MFDITAEIVVPTRPASKGGALTDVEIRFPTDEEWSAHLKKKKILVRDMGRGTEHVPAEPGELDIKLYTTIALNGAPVLTPAEAADLLDRLSVCKTLDVAITGVEAEVELLIVKGITHHRMKIPTMDQVTVFTRNCIKRMNLAHGQHTISFNVMAGAQVYDECGGQSADYPSGVPALHKDHVARAVMDAIKEELSVKRNDEDF